MGQASVVEVAKVTMLLADVEGGYLEAIDDYTNWRGGGLVARGSAGIKGGIEP